MIDMLALSATKVRSEWSSVVDEVVRNRPCFIKRTRDYMLLSDTEFIEQLLEGYGFTASEYAEDDGSVVLSLNEIDLMATGKDREDAVKNLAEEILEYACEYYDEFQLWHSAQNRKGHLPYVFKALILGDATKIGELIKCQAGRN